MKGGMEGWMDGLIEQWDRWIERERWREERERGGGVSG